MLLPLLPVLLDLELLSELPLSLLSRPLIGVKPRIPDAETDTPRRKKIRRLRFMVDSFGLFVVFVLVNSRYSCRGDRKSVV